MGKITETVLSQYGQRLAITVMACTLWFIANAQKRERYEFYKDFPVYADSLLAQLDYPLAWGNCGLNNFDEWKTLAKEKVKECMMAPPPPASNYDVKIIGEEKRKGYTARKIEFNLSGFYRVRAYMLIPDGKGPFPSVNLLHDHGAHLYIGKEKMIRPFADDSLVIADADKWVADLYGGQYLGDYLASNGYLVFSTDAPLWGERGRKEGVDRKKYDIIAGNMMMYGRNLCAFMTYDDIAATDFMATLPEVDTCRIGCVGFSMGAYRAWMLSALSDKIKACAAACWMTTTDVQMTWKYGRKESGGFANCIPALRQYLDYPHIAGIACPKPTLFINGTKDKLFMTPGVEKAFKIMRDIWKSQNAGDCLYTELWPITHSCGVKVQNRILEFLNKHLSQSNK